MESPQEISKFLRRISKKDFRRDLEPMREACSLLDNPQDAYPCVHIAGTNGKGSTAAFLNAILQGAGYNVGLMTSPHLIDVRERTQINRENISWEAFARLIREITTLLPREDFLSYFELMALIGFQYFAEVGVDFAVIETGLGGRLDATNVVKADVGILTPISFDHEPWLGDSLVKIAREKCGILKRGMRVISAPQTAEVSKVIEETCKHLRLELAWADPLQMTMPLGLAGDHQKINAACAWKAAGLLIPETFAEKNAAEALARTQWAGRLTRLRENPAVLVDGAHNFAGVLALAAHLKKNYAGKKIHFLIGVLRDKNWETMFTPLQNLARRFVCVTPPTGRGLAAGELAKALQAFEKPVLIRKDSIAKVFNSLLSELPPDEMLVATGSLYVVGEVLKCFPGTDSEG